MFVLSMIETTSRGSFDLDKPGVTRLKWWPPDRKVLAPKELEKRL